MKLRETQLNAILSNERTAACFFVLTDLTPGGAESARISEDHRVRQLQTLKAVNSSSSS